MATLVDTETFDLDHGGTGSATLTWNTSTNDKGDWTATASQQAELADSTTISLIETHTRTTTAVSPGGDASITRSTTASRTTTAVSPGGNVAVTWTAPHAWAVPTETGDSVVLLMPLATETDHEAISISAVVPGAKADALEYLEAAGDVSREDTAFGAFRRISRGAVNPITVLPPEGMIPPFAERTVHPTGYGVDEVAPDWWELSLDLGLDRPRAREPPATDAEERLVNESTVYVGAETTETATLKWTPTGSDLGEFLATAQVDETYAHPATEDSTLVTVSESPWVLDFGVASMNLTRENVRPISRAVGNGVPAVSLSIAVDGELASVIFAAGSRVDASQVRSIPDARNVLVDPLPDESLTIELVAPSDAEIDSGTYVLDSWSAARKTDVDEPYVFELTLLAAD